MPVPVGTRLRKLAELLLHPLLRRHARAVLRRHSRPAAVLVVCHGNICRSPFAAARLAQDLAGAGVLVGSAGFIGPDRACPPDAVAAAAQRGADLSTHRSALLTADVARGADLVVVMEPEQGRAICERFGRSPRDILVLGDLDPATMAARSIQDPVERGPEVFSQSYERIERCMAPLVSTLGGRRRARQTVEALCH